MSFCVCLDILISIHAPVKGATSLKDSYRGTYRISIHAPVKGATYLLASVEPVIKISIHAPVKGATLGVNPGLFSHLDFNPRTREGCDSSFLICCKFSSYFNPRTREGCDHYSSITRTTKNYFNPRTREGCDVVF